MKTACNDDDRRELQERLDRLTPDAPPTWGSMSAPQMVAHLADSLRMALGEMPVAPKTSPIRFTPLKQLVIYCLPFPKGVPTAPELIGRAPSAWQSEMDDVKMMLEKFGKRDRAGKWPDHPIFGRMRGTSWGVLVYRHINHHLRQFGQ